MRCHECDHGLECCHGTSILHADGASECLGDDPCGLAHGLHRWAVDCDEVGCACRADESDPMPLPLAA